MTKGLPFRLFDTELPPLGQQTLAITPLFHGEIEILKQSLVQTIGQLEAMQITPYLIRQHRYIQLLFKGKKGQFHLTLNIAGQTKFANLALPRLRYYIDVVDEFDAYYLIDLLRGFLKKAPLLCTKSVDNSVDKRLEQ